MGTPVILLNGPPSSGKTTLATALQSALQFPTFHLSLDDFRSGVEARFWNHLPGEAPPLFPAMVRAYLRALHAVASESVPVIAESIIVPSNRADYGPMFADFDVILVGVRCPLPVAQARENARTDRSSGPVALDSREFDLAHEQRYLLEVDTSREPTDQSVRRITAAFPTTWTHLTASR